MIANNLVNDENIQLLLLTEANSKIIKNIRLSLAIFLKLNNITHNNIETILKNEILPSSK